MVLAWSHLTPTDLWLLVCSFQADPCSDISLQTWHHSPPVSASPHFDLCPSVSVCWRAGGRVVVGFCFGSWWLISLEPRWKAATIRRVFTSHIVPPRSQSGSRVNTQIIKTNSKAGLPRTPHYFALLTCPARGMRYWLPISYISVQSSKPLPW